MPQREYSTERERVTFACKRITLPIDLAEYQAVVGEPPAFRRWLDEMIQRYPALFPGEIGAGYTLHDHRDSLKMPDLTLRRIKLKALDRQGQAQVFTIAPSGVLPYMTGATDEVEKALFLRRFGVPFWGLTYVFGHDDQYWYRLAAHFGRYDLVQTTVKDPARLPEHLLADEKHVHFNGETVYLATTVGADCVLGVSVALKADEAELTTAYGVFQQEAQQLRPAYTPTTVNTDGWAATKLAWQTLFPTVVLIACFLHAFLKIRDRSRRLGVEVWGEIQRQVWEIYHAPDAFQFHQRVQVFQHWARQTVSGTALEAIEKLCAKADQFVLAFDFPGAYRTSNMIDRHMEPQARWLFSMRAFHGDWASAERQVRAWALFHNFWPYCPRAPVAQRFASPVHHLTGHQYHANWLHNLLIATSMAGVPPNHKIQQN
jgi:hypothetical protein